MEQGRQNPDRQTWMITGISSGIGFELAEKLLAKGCPVVGFVRNRKKIRMLSEQYPDTLTVYEVDMRSPHEVDAVVTEACKAVPQDIVVVSNAGISLKGLAEEVEIEEIQDVINTNLMGAMLYIRACIPHLKQYGGKIVQISSINGEVPAAEWAYYCASKYGINGFCEAVAKELHPFKVPVSIVEPGNVNTELWNKVAGRRKEYAALRQRSLTTDIDVRKLAERIIAICSLDNPPEYMAMGSLASKRIMEHLTYKQNIYTTGRHLAREVDTDYKQGQPVLKKPASAHERSILMWPLGRECRNMLRTYNFSAIEKQFVGFVDSDKDKAGKYCIARKIYHYDELFGQLSSYYIIITSTAFYDEIRKMLEKENLIPGRDFCLWKDLMEDA